MLSPLSLCRLAELRCRCWLPPACAVRTGVLLSHGLFPHIVEINTSSARLYVGDSSATNPLLAWKYILAFRSKRRRVREWVQVGLLYIAMIAAAFLVLLRPLSIQCVLILLLLLLGTVATILFFCCWHRRLRSGKHPIKSVLSGRSRSRGEYSTPHLILL